jgi:FAD/FMN-containing dehydrogenase/Fe-S oxidoreductase
MSAHNTGLNTALERTPDQPDYVLELDAELRRRIDGEVRFDRGSRGAYSTDASNYRQVPIGVVVPRSVGDVEATVEVCRQFGAPIVTRGGGTSLAGQACNAAVVIDFSKYLNRIIEVDPDRRLARVQAGVVLDDLRAAAAKHGLTVAPDPATHSHCTIGGMIGNNSCGIHSVMGQFYGPGVRTEDSVAGLEVLTYDGARFELSALAEEEVERASLRHGRRGEIIRRLKDLRDRYGDLIRERYPDIPRRVSGYNLPALLAENGFDPAKALAGSEGTCAIVLEATVRLTPDLPERALVVLGYADVYRAADHVSEIMERKPVGLEGFDDELVSYMKKKGLHPRDVDLLPEGGGWLLVEFGADSREKALGQARQLVADLGGREDSPTMRLYEKQWEAQKLWEVRESGLGATAHVPGMQTTYPGWEDVGVPPERLGEYLRDFRGLLDDFGYHAALYGHFGQGCIHCRIDFGLDSTPGIRKYLAFIDRAADLIVRYGGSFSGEHGDGQARAALLPKMFGEELVEAFREFKRIWDPDWKMNPGKVVDPYLPDENLRLGPDYAPLQLDTHFQFPEDQGSFADALTRCVGVGKCRREGGGTMCPSYMVTKEEEHSTRGRARLLFEMLNGDPLVGVGNRNVHEALDLCLACKGCKNECPVNVDMATYKAEFNAHYYRGRIRPRAAYSMGLIHEWARLASKAPRLVNLATQTPPFAALLKLAGGIAQERQLPPFAEETFSAWFRRRKPPLEPVRGFEPERAAAGKLHEAYMPERGRTRVAHEQVPRFQSDTFSTNARAGEVNANATDLPYEGRRVLLWPDTFNDHFTPYVAKAAVEVLEHAGYEVEIPASHLCCGRPLYDWGMLDRAKTLWRSTLDSLRPYIRAGIPLVGLEPSCVAAFRDELIGLFPNDRDARRLSQQSYLFSEFLEHQGFEMPELRRKALVHGHCHHKAIIHMDAEVACLEGLGLDYQVIDSGCCGMAGSFGFEQPKYEVSIRAGERVLLPAVRDVDKSTLVIANGFSCREQIRQTTDRQALHLAQVIRMALESDGHGNGDYPERVGQQPVEPQDAGPSLALMGLGAALVVAGGLLARRGAVKPASAAPRAPDDRVRPVANRVGSGTEARGRGR